MRIGIYGGTFDPPHRAHLELAKWVREELSLDYIYFIPTAQHVFKDNKHLSPAEIRCLMVSAAIKGHNHLRISRVEVERGDMSYTADTLREFRQFEKLPSSDLYLIIGIDNLKDFYLWKDPDEILELAHLVVLRRSGHYSHTHAKQYQDRFHLLDSPIIEISATEVRKRIAKGDDVSDIIAPAVYEIIKSHSLYK